MEFWLKMQKEEEYEEDYDVLRWLRNAKWGFMFLDAFAFFVSLSIFGVCLWIRYKNYQIMNGTLEIL